MGRARRKHAAGTQKLARPEKQPTVLVEKDVELKGIDESNSLVLPDKKDRKLHKEIDKPLPRKLSKKQRKKFEKVLDQKRKKEKRSALLESLSSVQVSSSELALFDSVAHLGTKNSKLKLLSKRPLPSDLKQAIASQENEPNASVNSLAGKRKRRKLTKKEKPLKPVAPPQEEETEESSSDDEDQNVENDVSMSEQDHSTEDEKQEEKVEKSKNTENSESAKENMEIVSDQKSEPQSVKKEVEKTKESKPVTFVSLDRTAAIQEARLALPILAEEQVIMEAINENQVVVICGETGSGKTTQVPQFLYEAGYARHGMVGVTEPRRVAAVNMSKRVAVEMNLPTSKVSYQIRYDNNVTEDTCIKFMTDGVLAREMKADFLLTKYSVLILDEAHERTANTDLLIGLLSRVVPMRNKRGKPLKLIIMSATLRVEDFTKNERLFKTPPPVLKIETRQFPVTVHFSKRTPQEDTEDGTRFAYLDEAYKKICKIHRTLPAGGILVFVTGKQEVHALKRKLSNTFPTEMQLNRQLNNNEQISVKDEEKLPSINLDKYKPTPDEDEDEDFDVKPTEDLLLSEDEDQSDSELWMDDSAYSSDADHTLPMRVLPLYAMLPAHKQKLVFEPVPTGFRQCVIATNVAETSLTIPGVKYVVDTGKVKRRVYDKTTGVSTFRIGWVSKASANQRAGRAGRTEAGHTYRLFSSAVFQDFEDFDLPEISSKPVAGLVLQMKSMNIDRVVNFPFPTPPSHKALEGAEELLTSLGAIEKPPRNLTVAELKKVKHSGSISELGRLIASFPVHPRYGKMIAVAINNERKLLEYVITIVAALTVKEMFAVSDFDAERSNGKEKQRHLAARLQHMKVLWCTGGGPQRRLLGDPMVYMGAIGAAEFAGATPSYCANNCLRPKAIIEVRKLRSQLTNLVNKIQPECELELNPKMNPPNDTQVKHLRQIILSAMPDRVARRIPTDELPKEEAKKLKGAYRCALLENPIFIHPESILSRDPLPFFLVFQEVMETREGKKTYMRDITEIEPNWLATFCPQHCVFSKPLDDPMPTYDPVLDEVKCHVTATYGRLSWPLGAVEIPYPAGLDRFRWFARFLLEGSVMTSLGQFSSLFLSRPATMVKSWSNLQPRTESLLKALAGRGVDSKKKLTEIWKDNPSYLREELLEWLAPGSHQHFLSSWPLS
uniref:probable ATP-dependent RNA helicase DHX37 n=1 Tax=Ciona intestinalis TaxID=7719 RepID=UPI0002B8E4EF|nr:probable ATP-dependent RNA helicase DHX37 [Ciona intestinalis]|eukprot:XP_002123985.2 probable ATP-dependent RNA helicase DHX37 [Ciona intestinalis]